ncbi:GTP-binding protein [Laribacter hongkongensis]|uniref:CobW family GTP-binding protein n=1 Tax=Laribacter hongkongensis TaxID=168471 RepID=UPI001EFDA6E5|nr:GTP-binding protein [Laribacter hongkongensis]MCG9116712.1 GTP-binding protein [Laribacter hongkongensis]
MTARTPVNLVTGFLGAGKTSTILSLLAGKPAGETWAVIVNEFGEIGIDGAVLGDRDGLAMREIAGGCLCCVTGPQLTVTVARLIREVRPARLLIEASGLAHASNLVDDLRRDPLGQALDVQAVLAVVDPRQFVDLQYRQQPVYHDQIAIADVLVVTRCSHAGPAGMAEFHRQAAVLFPPKTAIVEAGSAGLTPALLDLPARPASRFRLPRQTPQTGLVTSGFVWPPEAVFDPDRVTALFDRLKEQVPGLVRAKAVFNLGQQYVWLNWTDGYWGAQPVSWRRDSRFELIAPAEAPESLAAGLDACLVSPSS